MFEFSSDLAKESNVLEVRVKDYGECGYCQDEDNRAVLYVPWGIWMEWQHISLKMKDKEWGAVFWVKDDTVTSYKIPKQEVSGAECEFKEELGGDGMVHSHHSMGAFHSAQDDRHARNLYLYSIVLSNKDGSVATKRIKLPCGGFGYLKLELCPTGLPEIDLSQIAERTREHYTITRREEEKQLGFVGDVPSCDECTSGDCENCPLITEDSFPCETCKSFDCKDCKDCKFQPAGDFGRTLPFCDFCTERFCDVCEKLDAYLKNYPEDKARLAKMGY